MTALYSNEKQTLTYDWTRLAEEPLTISKAIYRKSLQSPSVSTSFARGVYEESRCLKFRPRKESGQAVVAFWTDHCAFTAKTPRKTKQRDVAEEVLKAIPLESFKGMLKHLEAFGDALPREESSQPLRHQLARLFEEIKSHYPAISSWGAVDPAPWLAEASLLESQGEIDAALDKIYYGVDGLMREGRFSELSRVLDEIDINAAGTNTLLGLLTATLPARSKLAARATFLEESIKATKQRGDYEDGLFSGL